MSVSRRRFVTDASAFGLLAALLPDLAAAQAGQASAPQLPTEDAPHDSYDFWNGFYDSVNPYSRNYGKKSASRGPKDQLPDPGAETQYLHYRTDSRRLRTPPTSPRKNCWTTMAMWPLASLSRSSDPAVAKPTFMHRSFAWTPPRSTLI